MSEYQVEKLCQLWYGEDNWKKASSVFRDEGRFKAQRLIDAGVITIPEPKYKTTASGAWHYVKRNGGNGGDIVVADFNINHIPDAEDRARTLCDVLNGVTP